MKDERGQALTEFALLMPLFMLAAFAFLYLGLLVLNHMLVLTASVHAARVGVERCVLAPTKDQAEQDIAKAAALYAPGAVVTVDCLSDRVRVDVARTLTIPIPGMFQKRGIHSHMEYPLIVKDP